VKNKFLKLIAILLFPLLMGAAEFSDYTTLINQKMATERRLEDHLGGIVSKVVGDGKSTVIVSVELSDMTKSRVQTEQWLEKEKDKLVTPPKQEEFLPGIPMKNRIQEKDSKDESPEKSGGKRIEDILTLPAEFIKSIRVSLILDKNIPDEVVATVENVINDILDLNPARGDRLTIQRVDFAGRSVDFLGFLFNPYFYVISLVIITLTILALFLFGPLRKFLFATLQTLKDLKGMKSETEYSGAAAGGGGGGIGGIGAGMGEGEMEMEEEEGLEGEESEKETEGEELEGKNEEEEFEKMSYKPLKFLEDRDLKKLAYLLNFEKPEVGALLINYLEPEKGAKVMAAIPAEKRALVAKSIVKIQRSSKEIMQHIDDFLSRKIDYVAGGADKLVGVMEMMNEEDREKLLSILSEEDPEFTEKVKSKIFSFDNVIDLDAAAIQIVIQEVETRDLGIALKAVSEEIKEKFISNMSEGAAALLKEEIEFGKKATESQIKAKQVEIIAKIKHLESEGMISGVSGSGAEELWKEELGEGAKEGVLEEIIEVAHQALKKQEKINKEGASEEGSDETAFEYYELGLQAYKEEDYEGAIKNFSQSIKHNSDIWQTHQYIGACYLALGDEESARSAYSKSLELNPGNSELKEWLETH
jgi:flagellar motor switch protein FliG